MAFQCKSEKPPGPPGGFFWGGRAAGWLSYNPQAAVSRRDVAACPKASGPGRKPYSNSFSGRQISSLGTFSQENSSNSPAAGLGLPEG